MAYLAMARKWRPKNFEEMVGQDHIAQTIRNAIGGKRISHAYLFTGTRGVGKTTSARILAKALNCANGPTPTPCDVCENCKAVNNGNSMDVLEIDAASNTGVDNIRDLREQVKYAPMHGTHKVYVIDEVHMLSKSAFNALLKTLEEPPPHVVFIFATTEASKLPPTILSRVQRFDFKRISETRIRERLEYICSQEAIRPEREALEAIARKADGSMRDALSLFDQVYAFSGAELTLEAARKVLGLPREKVFDGLVRALAGHDQKACFDLLREVHREGVETGDLLIAFGEFLRNLLFASQGVSPAVLGLGDDRHAELGGLARELGLKDGDILRYAKAVSDLLAGLKTVANPGLSVELGFARMASLDRVVTLTQLLGGELPAMPSASAPAAAVSAPPAALPEDEAESKKKSPPEPLNGSAGRTPPTSQEPMGPPAGMERDPSPSSASASAFATAVMTAPAAQLGMAASADPDSIDPDYPVDPEDPDMPSLPPAPIPKAVVEEAVPVQDGPEGLPGVWPRLVTELMATRPILASHLRRSRLLWEPREENGSAALKLVFLDRAGYALIAEDTDFRKSIQGFLASKIRGAADFQLQYHLDEEAAASGDSDRKRAAGGDDSGQDAPIIGFIRELFEGRTVG